MYKAQNAELTRFERYLAGLPQRERDFELNWYTREIMTWTHRGEYSVVLSKVHTSRGEIMASCYFMPWAGGCEYVGSVVRVDAVQRAEALCAEHNRLQPPFPDMLGWPACPGVETWPCHDA